MQYVTNIEMTTELWDTAWSALAATGRDIGNGWMLMRVHERSDIPGGFQFEFKNHDLPFMTYDPKYDGRRKTVLIPDIGVPA